MGGVATSALNAGPLWYLVGLFAVVLLPPLAVIYTVVAWFQLSRLVRFNGNRRAKVMKIVVLAYATLGLLFSLTWLAPLLEVTSRANS